jgi:hypothetical protein
MRIAASLLVSIFVVSACGGDDGDIPRHYAPGDTGSVAPKSRAVEAAEAFGLSDAREVGAVGLWSCSDEDSILNSATVEGTNRLSGARVRVSVCCGWLKACTVRF